LPRRPAFPLCVPIPQGGRSLLSLVGLIADSDGLNLSGAPEFAIALRTQLLVRPLGAPAPREWVRQVASCRAALAAAPNPWE
jgi:hypothetical protein